jgi:excisionase family DNA binding protein
MNPVLTTDEVADLLECEPETVEDKLRRGELPGIKLGRSWMCPRDALMETLNDLAKKNLETRHVPLPIGALPTTRRGTKRIAPPLPKWPTSP